MIVVIALAVIITIAVIVWRVAADEAHKKTSFEKRHDGFTLGSNEPAPAELLAHRAQRLEEYWRTCGGILTVEPSVGKELLKEGSYWHKARGDMLTLYRSAAGAVAALKTSEDQVASVELLELEVTIRHRRAVCDTCLKMNSERVTSGKNAICELAGELGEQADPADGGGNTLWQKTYDIGPDGELLVRH